MIRKAMMFGMMAMALASAVEAAEPVHSRNPVAGTDATRVQKAAQATRTPARQSSARRVEPAQEFAGATMLRFFQKSVEAVEESGKGCPVQAGDSIRMAAY